MNDLLEQANIPCGVVPLEYIPEEAIAQQGSPMGKDPSYRMISCRKITYERYLWMKTS
jgi:hypothetical protein